MEVTLPQVFFKHFASKNQLPGLSVNGTLVENGLINKQSDLVSKCRHLHATRIILDETIRNTHKRNT